MFWAVSRVGGTFWAVSRVGGTFWAVSRVGSSISAVSGNYNYGVVFFGGIAIRRYVLAVCGISVFGGNVFGGRRYLHNLAVNRGLPGQPTRAVISRRESYRP